jgi:hypothetical protein
MIIFDGTYSLQPNAGSRPKPSGRWLCTWRVRIIDLAEGQPAVRHLKPTIVMVNPAGLVTGFTSCAESVGKKISRHELEAISKTSDPTQLNHEA